MLLVEDEPGIRTSLSLLLELEGYRLSTADNGDAGLAHMDAERPDLVITDYMMPGLDGLAMIRAMRAIPALADVPVLLMSGALPADLDPLEVADAFLQKPARIDRLVHTIQLLLRTHGSEADSRPRGDGV
ncbi:response regulator [Ectothiorhodospiraceae bacterium 2226]|nr:response regulator [Ectothiorhodospiraceae bacterium 2226]